MSALAKARYRRLLPALQDGLLEAQSALRRGKQGALAVIVTGIPAAGRSETINRIVEWLDPKLVDVYAYDKRTDEERARPYFWRHWRDLPARGRIAIYFGAWYEEWIHAAVEDGSMDRRRAEAIRRTEYMLERDELHLLKMHFQVSAKIQKKRLKTLVENPLTRWRVSDYDHWCADHYRRVQRVMRRCQAATNATAAKWHVIDGTDAEFRSLASGRLLLRQLRAIVRASPSRKPGTPKAGSKTLAIPPVMTALSDGAYDTQLAQLQSRLATLTRKRRFLKRSAVVVFEGMDAAGKGGAIRRLVQPIDVRQYRIVPVSAPSPDEQLYPYLWRFWRRLPTLSDFTIFDRSWYGRVLVERVRGFAAIDDWRRAYDEINEFERQLVEHDVIVCKFWLAVSREEQLRRFRERQHDPLKRYKVDPEDWINRRHFAAYQAAAADMVDRTHTRQAPWTVVNAHDKRRARLVVLRKVCEALEERL